MKNVRSYAIMDYLKGKQYCSIPELREKFGVSNATIHRDLAELEARGVIRRMRGGVALGGQGANIPVSTAFQERLNWHSREKQIIAEQAFTRIGDGDILFLDSSTTVLLLAQKLLESQFSSLTIVTNAVSIIQNFQKFPPHYVLVGLGGTYDMQLNAFLGQATTRELEQLSISKAFVSSFGLCDDSVTTNHEKHFTLMLKLMEMAEQRFLLLDRSKFDRKGLFRYASRQLFSEVITG